MDNKKKELISIKIKELWKDPEYRERQLKSFKNRKPLTKKARENIKLGSNKYWKNERIREKENNIEKEHPDICKFWDYKKNKELLNLNPRQFTKGSEQKVWWICKKNHSHEKPINEKIKGGDCGICKNKILHDYNRLTKRFPDLMKEWSFEKNDLDPQTLMYCSMKKVWWKCKSFSDHEWQDKIFDRTYEKYKETKTGKCPFCSEKKFHYTNSVKFRNPEHLENWDYGKNIIKPENADYKSVEKVWWICKKKSHSYEQGIRNKIQGVGCPKCSGHIVSEENNLLVNKPDVVKEWDYEKNKNRPEDYLHSSSESVWWKCKFGHSWETKILNRTNKTRGKTGCPKCKPKTSQFEIRLYSELKTIFKNIIWQHRIHKHSLDLFIEDYNLGIEYDGIFWHKNKSRNNVDIKKNQIFEKNNILLIKIRDEGLSEINKNDIIFYKNEKEINVIKRLLQKIEKIIPLSHSRKKIIDLYLENSEFVNIKEFNKILSLLPSPPKELSLLNVYPELCKEWDYEKNNPLKPEHFYPYSSKKVWWKCNKGIDHQWENTITARSSRNPKWGAKDQKFAKCPFCSGEKLSLTNNLENFPNLLAEFDYKKNYPLVPKEINSHSGKKIFWICSKNKKHKWSTKLHYRTGRMKTGCPKCPDPIDYNKSFEYLYPELTVFWDQEKNEHLKPSMITTSSTRDIFLKCEKNQDHKWVQKIAAFIGMKECPFCSINLSFTQSLPVTIKGINFSSRRKANDYFKIVSRQILSKRLKKGWDLEKAILTPNKKK